MQMRRLASRVQSQADKEGGGRPAQGQERPGSLLRSLPDALPGATQVLWQLLVGLRTEPAEQGKLYAT